MQGPDYTGMIEFLEKATLLAADLERRCASAAEQHARSAQELEQTLRNVEGDLDRIVSAGKDELARHAADAVRQALAQEVGMATNAISASAADLRQMSEQLKREQFAVGARMRVMGWKTIIAVGTAALVTVLGSGFALWHNTQRIQRTQVQAEVVEALRHVTVTSCDGRPCIKLAAGQPRWDKNPDYLLVDTSPSQAQPPSGTQSR